MLGGWCLCAFAQCVCGCAYVCMCAAAATTEDRGTFVYTWGAGYDGQLGRKGSRDEKKYSTVPVIIEHIKPTRQVSCGGLHTVALTDKGEVWAWGKNDLGQLGTGSDQSAYVRLWWMWVDGFSCLGV